jgi:hypothetical protein
VLVNPFTYGNPISDPGRFFGRVREAEQIFSRLRNPEFESSSVVGDRRIGKTSLLNYVAAPQARAAYGLRNSNYIFVYADLQMVGEATGPEQLWQYLLKQLREQCHDEVTLEALGDLLGRERPDGYDVAMFFQTAGARGQFIVFLLDEFDHVTANPNFAPDFYNRFRSLAIHHKVALVTSSRLELGELCHSESVRSSPFFNIFANVSLRPFSPEEARELVLHSLAPTGVRFTAPEFGQLLDLSGLHPYFLQAACCLLYEAYRQGLDPDARQLFLADRFRTEAVPHFADLWGNSTDPHKIVLTAAALLEYRSGRPGFTLGDLRQVYSRADPCIAALEGRGLVLRAGNGYRLFSSALSRWIVDRIAIESDDRRSFREWLAQHKDTRSQIRGRRNKPLRQVLPKVGPGSRRLILAWAKDPQSLAAMAQLLHSVLSAIR